MVLQDRDIIQINATVIAGVFVLLTVRIFAGALPEHVEQFFKAFYVASIVIPFAVSAIITIIGSLSERETEREKYKWFRNVMFFIGKILMIVGFLYLIAIMWILVSVAI